MAREDRRAHATTPEPAGPTIDDRALAADTIWLATLISRPVDLRVGGPSRR